MLTDLPGWVCVVAAPVFPISVLVLWRALIPKNGLTAGFSGFGVMIALFFGALILAAGGVAALKRLQRRRLYESQTGIASIRALSWRDFERLIGEAYRRQGYEVAETGGGGADGGIDLVLRRGNEKTVVQCKQWRVYKVAVQPIRELYGVMVAGKAQQAIFVTSGIYTQQALQFAVGKPLTLVDGNQLVQVMQLPNAVTHQKTSPPPAVPACPACGLPMVLRVAKKGANAGEEFWGCSGFPKCRGIRSLSSASA